VQIHLLAQIATPLAGIDELPGELESESDVVGAAAPLPVPHTGHTARLVVGLWGSRLVAVIAGAGLDAPFTAGPGDRVGHRRTGDCVDEARLSAA